MDFVLVTASNDRAGAKCYTCAFPKKGAYHDHHVPCQVGQSFDVAYPDLRGSGPQVGGLNGDARFVEVHVDCHVGCRAEDGPIKREVAVVEWHTIGCESAGGTMCTSEHR